MADRAKDENIKKMKKKKVPKQSRRIYFLHVFNKFKMLTAKQNSCLTHTKKKKMKTAKRK